jgi:hypothetical protein
MIGKRSMAKISKDEILEACVNGICKSFDKYLEWSGGEWLWHAPEYFLTVNIANELWAIDKTSKYITLEDNVRKTLTVADAKIKGKLSKQIRPNGRSDIVLWWGNGQPRGIIEVKHAIYNFEALKEDIDRILGILKQDSKIEFGITTFYIDRNLQNGNASNTL